MIKRKNYMKLGLAGGLAAASVLLLGNHRVLAADHAEAPGTMSDGPSDIADIYAWHTPEGTLVAALTFAGLTEAGVEPTYDADVLYGIHIDNNGDHVADIDIWARFGQNEAGEWGVQVINLPGADMPADPNICGTAPGHCGPINTVIDTGAGTQVFAGAREDPFFFDLAGYLETLDTGMLSFNPDNDSFAGLNVTALVLEMDAATAAAGSDNIQLWATTSRL